MKQSKLFKTDEPVVIAELDLKDAEVLAQQTKNLVAIHCGKIGVVGSIRRKRQKIHDIDFVVVTPTDDEWRKINEELTHKKAQSICSGVSVTKALLPYNNSLFQVDFYRAKSETFGINQIIRTGSADHNAWLATYAISKGMRLKYSEGVLKNGVIVAGEDEEAVFTALDLPYPEPEDREIVEKKPVWFKT